MGQTSDVFRLLVAAILGLAVLLIVLGIVAVIEEQKFELSEVRFYDGFGHAVNLPTNEVFREEKLAFRGKQMFTAESLSLQFKVEEECIQFHTSNTRIHLAPDGKSVEMANNIQTNVSFQCCYPDPPNPDCPPSLSCSSGLLCRVWFGEEPP